MAPRPYTKNSHRSDEAEHIKLMPSGSYQVMIGRNMDKHYLGTYYAYDDAVAARDQWLRRHDAS